MRTIATLTLIAFTTAALHAADQEGTVKSDEIALLSGPGTNMPETARLRRGAKLRVHHEEGDYYAVQPPAGCISWVRMSYLQFVGSSDPAVFPCAAVVDSNGLAKLRAGKVGQTTPLGVERVAVADGTVLTVVGQKSDDHGVKWYPIASPEGDYRYVLKSSVDLGRTIESKFTVASPNNGPTGIVTASGTQALTASIPPALGANWDHPQWIAAQQAERVGDLDRAESIYLELAKEMNRPGGTEKLAEDCYARIHDIRERRRKAGKASGQSMLTNPANDRSIPANSETMTASVNASRTRTTGSAGTVSGRNNLNATNTANPTNTGSNAKNDGETARWEGPGTLYLSALRVNGERVYALQSTPRTVLTYALPGKGIDLSRMTNQVVRLYGTVVPLTGYPGMSLMTVTDMDVVK